MLFMHLVLINCVSAFVVHLNRLIHTDGLQSCGATENNRLGPRISLATAPDTRLMKPAIQILCIAALASWATTASAQAAPTLPPAFFSEVINSVASLQGLRGSTERLLTPYQFGGGEYSYITTPTWQVLKLTVKMSQFSGQPGDLVPIAHTIRETLRRDCGSDQIDFEAVAPRSGRVIFGSKYDTFMTEALSALQDAQLLGTYKCVSGDKPLQFVARLLWDAGQFSPPTRVIPQDEFVIDLLYLGSQSLAGIRSVFDAHKLKTDQLRAGGKAGAPVQVLTTSLPATLVASLPKLSIVERTGRRDPLFPVCGLLIEAKQDLFQVQVGTTTLHFPKTSVFPQGMVLAPNEVWQVQNIGAPLQYGCLQM